MNLFQIQSVSDYSLEKANAILGKEIVDSLFSTVDGALVITEDYLDRFLPPTEGKCIIRSKKYQDKLDCVSAQINRQQNKGNSFELKNNLVLHAVNENVLRHACQCVVLKSCTV